MAYLDSAEAPEETLFADDADPAPGDAPKANPYEDLAEISRRIDKVLETDKFSRTTFERGWMRNILADVGAQWLVYSKGRFRQRNLPDWFPRAMTNKFAEKKKDLVSQFVNGERIPITWVPATEDPASDATAEVGERIRDVFYAESAIESKKADLATWFCTTGNMFGVVHYDMDPKHGKVFVQHQSCPACGDNQIDAESLAGADGACPTCGAPPETLQPSADPAGNAIGEEMPVGALQLDVVPPFEIRGDYRLTNVEEWPRFVRQRRYDVDKAKELWKTDANGKDITDQIVPDTSASEDTSQYYLDVIAHLTADFTSGPYSVTSDGTNNKTPKLTAYEIYEMPSEKFPQGLRAVRLGKTSDLIVQAGPLPTEYGAGVKKGQKFLGLVHGAFEKIAGRFYGKTPLDDVLPLQLFRNVVEANIRLSVQRMGNAVWLIPKGSGVDILTGEPGQKVEYNPISVGGTGAAKPERLPAELNNLGALVGLLNKIDDAIERVSGTFFLQGGSAPPGVTAASALAYLGEKGQQSFSSPMVAWVNFFLKFEMYALEICRANWNEARIRRIMGKNKKWQTEKFEKADIQGAVDMIPDYKGAAPKSLATEQAKIAQLTQMGYVSPVDEEMRITVLRRFGVLDLKGSVDKDITYAAKTWDKFMAPDDPTGQAPPFVPQVRPLIDNSAILLAEGISNAKTDEFDELPPEKQQIWTEYLTNLATDIATRRMMLTQAGLDPDVPALAEIPSGEAAAALAAAAGQNGGVPNGAEGPDPRLDPQGLPLPTPDIGAVGPPEIDTPQNPSPDEIHPAGSPQSIRVPQ